MTICTARRGRELGLLADGQVVLSPVGRLVEETWNGLPHRMPHVRQDAFIVMPDHLHGLVRLWAEPLGDRPSPTPVRRFGGSQRGALSLAINLFKGDVTRAARILQGDLGIKIWQRGYHERIIRTEKQMAATRAYILNNPIRG